MLIKVSQILDERSHVEWSILEKIAKTTKNRETYFHDWPSPEIKIETLRKKCVNGKIIGLSAKECLTIGGSKNLMLIDIDSSDKVAVNEWLNTQQIFPKNSFVHINSTTLNSHIYVSTKSPLTEDNQQIVRQIIKKTMNQELARHVDLILGPCSNQVLFLPIISLIEATTPQALMSNVKNCVDLSFIER